MNKAILSILLYAGLVFGAQAQNMFESGSIAAGYTAPGKNEIRLFTPADGKFTAALPGVTPKVIVQDMPGVKAATYSIYRVNSNAAVSSLEFDFNVEKTSEDMYSQVKSQLLSLAAPNITAELDVKQSGRSAREFVVSYGANSSSYLRMRVVTAGNRAYQLKYSITSWSTLSRAQKGEFEKEAKRFFDSFVIAG